MEALNFPGQISISWDVQNGRINYLGWIKYKLPGKDKVSHFFH